MADVQLENGYTRIANELLEALIKHDFTASQYKIIFAIIRKTYGWNKAEDSISVSQFEELTGLHRRTVQREMQKLKKMNVVKPGKIEKDFHQWVGRSTDHRSTDHRSTGAQGGGLQVSKGAVYRPPTKDIKDTIQKTLAGEPKKVVKKSSCPVGLSYFGEAFLRKTGSKYLATFTKEVPMMQEIEKTYGDKVNSLIDKFFDSEDKFIQEAGYSVGIFRSVIHKLLYVNPDIEYKQQMKKLGIEVK